MRKIIIPIFLVLTFLCSTAMSETAADWNYKASLLWDTNPKKAIEYLNKSIKLKSDDYGTYYLRGTAYFKLVQYQRAIEDYNEVIRLKPNYVEVYYNRGLAYDKLGQYQRAIENYTESIRLQPNDVDSYVNRGLAYSNLKQYQRAITDCN